MSRRFKITTSPMPGGVDQSRLRYQHLFGLYHPGVSSHNEILDQRASSAGPRSGTFAFCANSGEASPMARKLLFDRVRPMDERNTTAGLSALVMLKGRQAAERINQ